MLLQNILKVLPNGNIFYIFNYLWYCYLLSCLLIFWHIIVKLSLDTAFLMALIITVLRSAFLRTINSRNLKLLYGPYEAVKTINCQN